MADSHVEAAWLALEERVPLLAKLPGATRPTLRMRRMVPGETLFACGDRPRSMYVVVSGEVRLIRRSASGAVIILQRASRGFLAEASFGQPAYHCDAIAARISEVVAIPGVAFEKALDDRWFRH